jgi:hypothetical protein
MKKLEWISAPVDDKDWNEWITEATRIGDDMIDVCDGA